MIDFSRFINDPESYCKVGPLKDQLTPEEREKIQDRVVARFLIRREEALLVEDRRKSTWTFKG